MYDKQQVGDTIFERPGYVDIHSHILPGLDDGPVNPDQSLEAAKEYVALGFSTVIATPHWITATRWASTPDVIAGKVKEINTLLRNNNIALTVLPGMEIACSERLYEHVTTGQCLSLGNGGFFLIEFPLAATRTGLSEHIIQKLAGDSVIKFILAHPERCPVFDRNQNLLERLVSLGILAQVNINSVLGEYGKKIQKSAFRYIQSGLVHFLATDSHARGNRMPPSASQWEKLVSLVGEDMIETAFGHNPKQMLAGKDVVPLALDSTQKEALPGQRLLKALWNRFGKR